MEIINCPRCGKLFSKMSSPICELCQKEEEEIFQRVRKYIEENPNCTVTEVTVAVDVSVKKIMRYLREGRLEVSQGMVGELRCEKCGKPIRRGHYCDACVIDLNQEVVEMFDSSKSDKGSKMHSTRERNN